LLVRLHLGRPVPVDRCLVHRYVRRDRLTYRGPALVAGPRPARPAPEKALLCPPAPGRQVGRARSGQTTTSSHLSVQEKYSEGLQGRDQVQIRNVQVKVRASASPNAPCGSISISPAGCARSGAVTPRSGSFHARVMSYASLTMPPSTWSLAFEYT